MSDFSPQHTNNNELQLYFLGRLSTARGDTLEHHVSQCRECKDQLETIAKVVARLLTSQSDRGSDGQKEARLRTRDTGFLRSFLPLTPGCWPVQIVDVSRHGIGLLFRRELAPDTLVQVQIGEKISLGQVKYSKRISEQEFRIGIRVRTVWIRQTA